MSNPLCLNERRFLMMKNRIKNAVVKLGIMDGLLWPLFVLCVPFDLFRRTFVTHTTAFPKRFKRTVQLLAVQPSTNFRTQLNTTEAPTLQMRILASLASFSSLRISINHNVLHGCQKIEHNKTRKNTPASILPALDDDRLSATV